MSLLLASRVQVITADGGLLNVILPANEPEIERRQSLGNNFAELSRLDFHSAFPGKVCPYPPRAFALFQPND